MPGCCVPNCKNRNETGFRLFRIPRGKNNEERRKLWLNFINRDQLPQGASICEAHFEENQFECHRADNRKLLKWNAVPSIRVREFQSPPPKKKTINHCMIQTVLVLEEPRITIVCEEPRITTVCEESSITNVCEEPRITNVCEEPRITNVREEPRISNACGNAKICSSVKEENGVSETANDSFVTNAQYQQLKNKLKNAYMKINKLEKRIKEMEDKYSKVFSKDQMILLTTGSHRGVEWSDESITNGLKLYYACGTKGYEEILKQNLPYPSIRTLQHRIQRTESESDENIEA